MSLFYIFTWLIVRNMPTIKGLENLVLPLIISTVYTQLMIQSMLTYVNGMFNPTVVFFILMWDLAAYWQRPVKSGKTIFESNYYGEYVWVYITAPILAGLVAGVIFAVLLKVYSS